MGGTDCPAGKIQPGELGHIPPHRFPSPLQVAVIHIDQVIGDIPAGKIPHELCNEILVAPLEVGEGKTLTLPSADDVPVRVEGVLAFVCLRHGEKGPGKFNFFLFRFAHLDRNRLYQSPEAILEGGQYLRREEVCVLLVVALVDHGTRLRDLLSEGIGGHGKAGDERCRHEERNACRFHGSSLKVKLCREDDKVLPPVDPEAVVVRVCRYADVAEVERELLVPEGRRICDVRHNEHGVGLGVVARDDGGADLVVEPGSAYFCVERRVVGRDMRVVERKLEVVRVGDPLPDVLDGDVEGGVLMPLGIEVPRQVVGYEIFRPASPDNAVFRYRIEVEGVERLVRRVDDLRPDDAGAGKLLVHAGADYVHVWMGEKVVTHRDGTDRGRDAGGKDRYLAPDGPI